MPTKKKCLEFYTYVMYIEKQRVTIYAAFSLIGRP